MQNKRVVKLISSNSKKETQYVEKKKKKKDFPSKHGCFISAAT